MNREVHVRFCEGLGVQFPGPTRQFPVDDVTIRRKLVALKAEHVDGEQDASERRQPRILSLGQSTLIHIGRSVWRTE